MNFNWYRSLQLTWRKFKRSIEWVAFGLFDTVVLLRHKPQPNETLSVIVHVELLGDYVLWWPYAQALVKYLRNQGKQVVLVLNTAVLPVATRHFPECAVLGIDRASGFVRDLKVRAAKLRKLRGLGASTIYLDSHPRDALIGDAVVRALAAPAWGFNATFADRPWFDQMSSRRLYTHLLPAMEGAHQHRRHHAFIQSAGVPDDYLKMLCYFAEGLEAPTIKPYFVIAPGASRSKRRWPVNHFVAVAQRVLTRHPDWRCMVVGIREEQALGEAMVRALGERVDNLAGKTDLLSLVRWIAHARLLLGNDSAAVHLAAACGVNSVVIVGGGHFGRCFPYDTSETCVRPLPCTVSEPMDCFGCDWLCRYRVEKHQPFPCIATIPVELVWNKIEPLLSSESL